MLGWLNKCHRCPFPEFWTNRALWQRVRQMGATHHFQNGTGAGREDALEWGTSVFPILKRCVHRADLSQPHHRDRADPSSRQRGRGLSRTNWSVSIFTISQVMWPLSWSGVREGEESGRSAPSALMWTELQREERMGSPLKSNRNTAKDAHEKVTSKKRKGGRRKGKGSQKGRKEVRPHPMRVFMGWR